MNEEQQSRIKITFKEAIEKIDYPLGVVACEADKEVIFTLKYAGELFGQETIERILSVIKTMLVQITSNPYGAVETLNYLTEEDYHQIVYAWNATDKAYPDDQTIQRLFEEQVEKTPDNVAVVYEGTTLTYRELNTKANQLAHTIRQTHAIQPDTLIALCLERSEHMLIGILAVLKAGGAYVPMDPGYPDERIRYILGDTQTPLILTNSVHQQRLESLTYPVKETGSGDQGTIAISDRHFVEVMAIDSERFQEVLSTADSSNPATDTQSTHLAYVIYTSGTTGNPKGVMIEHKGVVNRITWMNEIYPLDPRDKILHKTPYIFDVSVWELFWAHWYGASVIIAEPEKHKDAHYIVELMHQESITIVHFVPSMLGAFNAALREQKNNLPKLRYLFCSGEALTLPHVQECHTTVPSTQIHNLYGPTEASIEVLFSDCTDKNIKSINIGHPIFNTRAYVLSSHLTPLPIGAIGELYIGGAGLARGYLNNPALTAERFIANPFQTSEERERGTNARLYKTGDLVRWLPDGNLDYIGRNDFQVKIRGYRIELGEIEAALSRYEGVTQSVVLAKEHVNQEIASTSSPEADTSRKYLVGYYVSERPLDEAAIIRHLQARLPEYMVPQMVMHLPQLPLTLNGKLDRKALPEPRVIQGDTYVAPRTEVEQKMVQIWSEVLGLSADQVGIHDDFFRLGGDSILAIRLVSKINKLYQCCLKISDIFIYKRIESMVNIINDKNNHYIPIINLNNSYSNENIFMIHPGSGGCEVYSSLAAALASDFICYGIDPYNLYNEHKIDNLHELSKYYLKNINETMLKNNNCETYNLLGWSLGGNVSLEIASILENQGHKNINIYLLDTIIKDKFLLHLQNEMRFEDYKKEIKKNMLFQENDKEYIKKFLTNIDIERRISEQKISSTLKNTSILLFKAILEDISSVKVNSEKSNRYIKNLQYNNIDNVVDNKDNIKVIKIINAHHGNILKQEELIVSEIRRFLRVISRNHRKVL